jgi:hypothetical protein
MKFDREANTNVVDERERVGRLALLELPCTPACADDMDIRYIIPDAKVKRKSHHIAWNYC